MTPPKTPPKESTSDEKWNMWWKKFQELANNIEWPINKDDPGVYKEQYFDDELTPSEALAEDITE